MSEGEDDPDAIAAEYVLGLLSGPDEIEAERRIAADEAFAAAVAAWRTRLAALDMTATQLPADERLWTRIARDLALPAAIRARRRDAAAMVPRRVRSRPKPRLWDSLAFWRGLAAGAVAAATALVALVVIGPSQVEQPAFVAVLTTDAGRPGAVIHAYADGRVTLVPLEVAPIPSGRTLQVWTMPAPAAAPIAIGLVDQVRTTRLDLRNLSPAGLRQQFAISLEPAGGSPTGLPTGPVVMQGDLASAR